MSDRRTDDTTLIAALRILARDIQSGDSCANACLLEAAARMAELVEERRSITTLLGKVESLEADNERLREERRRREALWQASADETRGYDESVRVVEETHFDDLAQVVMERDAAIRERDAHKEEYYKLRGERITQALTADRFASVVAEADRLRARVAELEQQAKSLKRSLKETVVGMGRAMAERNEKAKKEAAAGVAVKEVGCE